MRRMSASSIAEARQLQQEQLVQQLSTWSMKDASPPPPDPANGLLSLQPLDRCAAIPAMHEPLQHSLVPQAGKHASL